jgi:hypothetical protein
VQLFVPVGDQDWEIGASGWVRMSVGNSVSMLVRTIRAADAYGIAKPDD